MQKKKFSMGETPSLKQQVYDVLRMQIISGELAPGEKLHEDGLAGEFGISRAPLREALNMLERDGFARIIPRKGAVVAGFAKEDIGMLWDIRELLEPYAAVASIPYVPKDKLKAIRENLDWVMQNPDDFQRYMETDIEVHALSIDYLQNHYLSSILRNVKDHSLRMRWIAERQSADTALDIIKAAVREHIDIVEAFEKKDEVALFRAVQYHIHESRQRTMTRIGKESKT